MKHLPMSIVYVPLQIFLILILIDFSFFAILNNCYKKKVNQSGNTANLFWVRMTFIFASFLFLHLKVLFYVDKVKQSEEIDKSEEES
jgi:hypothetical protein